MLHGMQFNVLSGRPRSPYAAGARCDTCSKSISGLELIFHCDICQFDLCQNCMQKIVNKMSVCGGCGKKSVVRMIANDLRSKDKEVSRQECMKCKETHANEFAMVCKSCGYLLCSRCYHAEVVCTIHSYLFDIVDCHYACVKKRLNDDYSLSRSLAL